MKRDVQENDEEAVQVKEQSILELGSLLAKTGQAEGEGGRGGSAGPGGSVRCPWCLCGDSGCLGTEPHGAQSASWRGGWIGQSLQQRCVWWERFWASIKLSGSWKRVNGGEKIAGCSSRWLLHRRCAEVPQLCCLFCFLPSQSWGGS